MNKAKNLIVPGALAVAVLGGVSAGAVLNGLGASADTTSTTTYTTSGTSVSSDTARPQTPPDPSKGGHTANGKTETVLTGDTLTKATAAAKKAISGGTVIRAETDAEGAAYEVHMTKSDGSSVTVKLDSGFNVTSTEAGMH
jgi:outer membrane lipoprotein SlyB